MGRSRHPKKPIEEAIQYAEEHGWTCEESKKGHIWGTLLCPHHDRSGCRFFVYGTPKSPDNHAKRIRNRVDGCNHT